MVEKHDIMSKILHKLNTLDPIRNPETSEILLILLSMFFSRPSNYYNYYNVTQHDVVYITSNLSLYTQAEHTYKEMAATAVKMNDWPATADLTNLVAVPEANQLSSNLILANLTSKYLLFLGLQPSCV